MLGITTAYRPREVELDPGGAVDEDDGRRRRRRRLDVRRRGQDAGVDDGGRPVAERTGEVAVAARQLQIRLTTRHQTAYYN